MGPDCKQLVALNGGLERYAVLDQTGLSGLMIFGSSLQAMRGSSLGRRIVRAARGSGTLREPSKEQSGENQAGSPGQYVSSTFAMIYALVA